MKSLVATYSMTLLLVCSQAAAIAEPAPPAPAPTTAPIATTAPVPSAAPSPAASSIPTTAPSPTASPVAATQHSPSQSALLVPAGTPIDVHLAEPLEGSQAKIGDTFVIKVSKAVVINNLVAIPEGAGGQGTITAIQHAKRAGHGGTMQVQMNFVYGPDGEKIDLMSDHTGVEGKGNVGASSTVTIVSWAALGLPGLFAHNFFKGSDAQIQPSQDFHVYVKDTASVAYKFGQ